MRWTGTGGSVWRVRVDLFAELRDPRRQLTAVRDRLEHELTEGDGDRTTDRGAVGCDQGKGAAGRDVVGILFWVGADDVGQAATKAVEVARRVGAPEGVGPGLYDVTVIPRDAVSFPQDERVPYPRMPD